MTKHAMHALHAWRIRPRQEQYQQFLTVLVIEQRMTNHTILIILLTRF